ncbi:MAG: RidA family protein [Acidobacteria bacterium]|nr:RidA family protein [Acidobacteriota bacterium]
MKPNRRLARSVAPALLAALAACAPAPPPFPPKMPIQRQFLNVGEKPNGYTHTVTTTPGRMVFVSGAAGANPDGSMPEDFATQADNTFKSLRERLALAGADFDDVVKINYFLRNMDDLAVLREVRARYLNAENPPAASAIPAPFTGAMMLEVEAIAVVED